MDELVNVEIFKRYTPSEYKLINITQLTFTCSKLTIETLEKGVFIVNFEHIFTPFSSVSVVDIEQVNVSWEIT